MKGLVWCAVSGVLFSSLAFVSLGLAQDGQRRGGGRRELPAPRAAWQFGSVILGNPSDRSVELVVHPKQDGAIVVRYGEASESLNRSVKIDSSKQNSPARIKLSGLKPNTLYRYQLDLGEGRISPGYAFMTQRAAGSAFSFMVQGDSHPERVPKMNVPSLYERTLLTASEHRPDFFICMGDDFSVDTLRERTKETVNGAYRQQVPYLGLVGHSSAVFLVNGNHEQASKANLDGTPNSIGVWAREVGLISEVEALLPALENIVTAFAHQDLHADNVLIDDDGEATFIDWGDAGFGDPACDFRFIPVPYLRAAIKGYGGAVDLLVARIALHQLEQWIYEQSNGRFYGPYGSNDRQSLVEWVREVVSRTR